MILRTDMNHSAICNRKMAIQAGGTAKKSVQKAIVFKARQSTKYQWNNHPVPTCGEGFKPATGVETLLS